MIRHGTLAVVVLTAACERPSSETEGARSRSTVSDSALRATPGYIVDNALPPAEHLRRFRVGVDSVARLGGPPARELLMKAFFAALEKRDVAALRALAVTRAEYAWLVFPGSRISLPPYKQPPDVAWLLMQTASNSGLRRLVERAGSGQVRYVEHACASVTADAGVRVHSGCTVRVFASGQYFTRRFFGSIVERNGRYKFLGLDNDY